MWPTFIHIVKTNVGSRKVLWPTIIGLFRIAVGFLRSLTPILQIVEWILTTPIYHSYLDINMQNPTKHRANLLHGM